MVNIRQDENGWTHIDWALKGVTANMIDWHWSNMEKTFFLWHPVDHKGFRWAIQPTKDKFLGCIHLVLEGQHKADDDLEKVGLRLRYYDVAASTKKIADLIIYNHVCLVGSIRRGDENDPPESYVMHQWQSSDDGVVGMSSGLLTLVITDIEKEKERSLNWSKHAISEISNFGIFLSDIYRQWSVVKNPNLNVFHSLKVEKTATGVRYVNLQQP